MKNIKRRRRKSRYTKEKNTAQSKLDESELKAEDPRDLLTINKEHRNMESYTGYEEPFTEPTMEEYQQAYDTRNQNYYYPDYGQSVNAMYANHYYPNYQQTFNNEQQYNNIPSFNQYHLQSNNGQTWGAPINASSKKESGEKKSSWLENMSLGLRVLNTFIGEEDNN